MSGQELALTKTESFTLKPNSFTEAVKFAELMASSEMVPKDYRGKPANVLVAVQMGAELGLAPMQALQSIAVINGRTCIWGDGALALVQASGKLDWIKEWHDGEVSYCQTKRKGYPEPYTNSFSDTDARAAKLLSKPGPWQEYKLRMRQMRTRAFNLRDQFADVLKGLSIREEVEDYNVRTIQAVPEPVENVLMPKRKSEAVISEEQRKALYQACKSAGLEDEAVKSYLKDVHGLESSKDILQKDYAVICQWVQAMAKPTEAEVESL